MIHNHGHDNFGLGLDNILHIESFMESFENDFKKILIYTLWKFYLIFKRG